MEHFIDCHTSLYVDDAQKKAIMATLGDHVAIDAVEPLTTTQRDLYLDALKNPRGKGHQVVLYGIIDDEIDLLLWQENLRGFVDENPILRTKLLFVEDQVYQVAIKDTEPLYTLVDYSALSPAREDIRDLVQKMEFPDQDLTHPLVHHYLLKINQHCYVVLFRIHHVLIDGSCGKIYVEKICNRYYQFLRNIPLDGAIDYAFFNYVPVHLDLFDRPATLDYWKKALAEINIADGQYGNTQQDQVVSELIVVPAAHHADVAAYCRQHNIKESYYWMLVLAIVYRYQFDITGDFTLRTFAGGRRVHHDGSTLTYEQTLGCFYHIFPVIFPGQLFDGQSSAADIISGLAAQVSGLGSHRFISMKAQNSLLAGESLTLYYNYQPFWEIAVDGHKSYFEERYHEMGDQIEFRIAFTHDQLELHLDYNTRYFNGYNFLERILLVSTQLVEKAGDIAAITYLLPQEEALFSGLNTGRMLPPSQALITTVWEEAVRQYPEMTAATCRSMSISYAALDSNSDHVAAWLQHKQGINPGDVVGLLLPRSIHTLSLILGIWKTGAIYLPFSEQLPTDRIATIAHTAGLSLLLVDDGWLGARREPLPGVNTWPLSAIEEGTYDSHIPVSLTAGHPAYIIFTSGSTGTPKGACVTHDGMMNHLLAKKELLNLGTADRIAQNASASFDISVWQLFNALLDGGRTIIYTEETILETGEFLSRVTNDGITLLEVVPSYLELLLENLSGIQTTLLSDVRYLVVTGEELKPRLVNRWFGHFPHIPIINAYGPTEAADDITHHVITGPVQMESIPVGKPIPNMSIYIVNGHDQRCGIYMKGEICVAGAGVGKGYMNDKAATLKAFTPDPWQPGLPMYRTGDTGRWLPDGTIDFIGRRDNQIKLKGYRIELAEIEQVTEQYPAVTRAVATVIKDTNGMPSLCCYYTATAMVTEAALYAFLKARLPVYMVPAHLLQLPVFPLTAHGKINRKTLPLPREIQATIPDANALPLTADTDLVCRIWCEVLQVNNYALTDNFFEKGGDSIRALKLVNRIRKELNVELPVTGIFRHPDLQYLQQAVSGSQLLEDSGGILSIPVIPPASDYALSFGQQRLLLTEKLSDTGAAYVMVAAVRFTGALDRAAFEWATDQLISRHEILRVCFIEHEGQLRQVFHPAADHTLSFRDLRLEADPEATMLTLAACEADTPFQLHQPPLFRGTLLQLEDEVFVFLYAVHHLLTDGWSKNIIGTDLARLYNKAIAGDHTPLPALPLQYKDYCYWQRQQLTSARLQAQQQYWRRTLGGALPVTTFSPDFKRPSQRRYEGETLEFSVSAGLTKQLQDCCVKEGITLFHLTIAAVNLILYQYTGVGTLLIGTSASGRNLSVLEEQIGFYVNTLPLLNTINADLSLKENLSQISRNILAAFEAQEYPFLLMLEDIDAAGNHAIKDLINVYVEYHNYRNQSADLPWQLEGLQSETIREHHVRALFDIEFNFEIKEEALCLLLIYNKSLYREDAAALIGYQLIQLLEYLPERINECVRTLTTPAASTRDMPEDELFNFSI